MKQALVVGAGPAGLMAAHTMAKRNLKVTIVDAMPSIGRKFLMAGKSGLNLTKNEPIDNFLSHFAPWPTVGSAVAEFGPSRVIEFANGLGQQVFTGTSGRVFPEKMKASPMLRAWMKELNALGVDVHSNHVWDFNLCKSPWDFRTPAGTKSMNWDVVVLALGGGSWARLGSNGRWLSAFMDQGVHCQNFVPSNCGFHVDWSSHMERYWGQPVKNCKITVDNHTAKGEFVIGKRGVEGGIIYAVSSALCSGATAMLDLKPDLTLDHTITALSKPRGKNSFSNFLRKSLKLSPVKTALIREVCPNLPKDPIELANLVKKLRLKTKAPFPIDEAISTAGGIDQKSITEGFMLRNFPGVFCAGEMLDWDAPTGGYLITGCFATGLKAGHAAADFAFSMAR